MLAQHKGTPAGEVGLQAKAFPAGFSVIDGGRAPGVLRGRRASTKRLSPWPPRSGGRYDGGGAVSCGEKGDWCDGTGGSMANVHFVAGQGARGRQGLADRSGGEGE